MKNDFDKMYDLLEVPIKLSEIAATSNEERKKRIIFALCIAAIVGGVLMGAIIVYLYIAHFNNPSLGGIRKQTTFLAALIFIGGLVVVLVAESSLSSIFQTITNGETENIKILAKSNIPEELERIIKSDEDQSPSADDSSEEELSRGSKDAALDASETCLDKVRKRFK